MDLELENIEYNKKLEILEINLKEYRNDLFGAVSSAGRALPF